MTVLSTENNLPEFVPQGKFQHLDRTDTYEIDSPPSKSLFDLPKYSHLRITHTSQSTIYQT